jgi:hypothetical protein
VTGGARQGERPWFGEYVSVTLVAGLSAYVDAVHQQGSLAWYPVGGPRGAAFVQLDRGSGAVRTLVVGGLRYSFVNGTDARVEYMHQDAGYRRSQFALAALAVATQPSRETADRWLRPGLEFAGRDFVLGSVRVPAVPPVRRVGLHAQYLASLTDRSGLVYVTTTVDASGALVVFGTVTATYGDDVAEFSRLVRASVVGGVVWSWEAWLPRSCRSWTCTRPTASARRRCGRCAACPSTCTRASSPPSWGRRAPARARS